ncbi:MAG: ISKra4 family transposase [Cyanobacteria bacterium P01_D01_bin.115]
MDAAKKAELQAHARAIAALLYEEADAEQVHTLAGIEETVRAQVLEHVSPEIGGFFIETSSGTTRGRPRTLGSILGKLTVTDRQAQRLKVKAYTQWSPYLERCCLLLSANESYDNTANDLEVLTGVAVSHSTQQRMVHRQSFDLPEIEPPVETMSLDGGKVRLRTPPGEECIWRDYKAVNLDNRGVEAFFRENASLVEWVNAQPLADRVMCLGDGHDGIWNLFAEVGTPAQRYEILDWYHLVENLGKVRGSLKRLNRAESLLWQGKVDETLALFEPLSKKSARDFCNYLRKHRARIVNYAYCQSEGIPIGSGAVESTVKQIGRRIKISGAQWERKNVPQILKHRCAYLNGQFSQ